MMPEQLVLLGVRRDRAEANAGHLGAAMAEFDIVFPKRPAAFLAQILHESGMLKWPVEMWGPTDSQRRYEVRQDLGNCRPGDGYRFRGRGWIQTTGRANYEATGNALGVDLLAEPERLAEPELAARSAAWFWASRGLNTLADGDKFEAITRRINGGLNGYADRLALWAKAKTVLA